MMSHKAKTSSNACFVITASDCYIGYFELADIGFYHMIPIHESERHYDEEMWDLADVLENMPHCSAYAPTHERRLYRWG